ncbi:MAG TPA: endonuclease MutS2 [Dysgonamonadaceae bacterium]|nr:endonuclease MutS2 [Dysgonamonadaceae bacterium]
MIYPDNFEYKIEFYKIRQLLSATCLSTLGKEKVEEMQFSTSFDEIELQLNRTDEFVHILEDEDTFPSDHFYDVRTMLKRIRVIGTWIDIPVMFQLKRSLQTINSIVSFLRKEDESDPVYPNLSSLTDNVVVYPEITKRIDSIIDANGDIKDNASSQLADIRRQLANAINSISKNLHTILRKAQAEGYVDKDVSPSMRDGRLVIPVNPAYKRKIKGIVHDESASGKTVFIEPGEVVEANNRVRELENDERREIIKILSAFTDYLRPYLPDLLESYEFLAQIDFIRAKAKFGLQINAIKPAIDNKQQIDWVRAYHPLLYLALSKQQRKVVPLDITLQDENRILIISGPNAGGKSVCLKTVGLLQYMVQCGLMIPVKENSNVGVFDDIFIDIGDEQSIEDDLSTYSSHLLNMKFFVKNCNAKSLLLIDEFGSGTEPEIGAAIAEALLERYNAKQSFGVITTHYQNLKHFANENEGVVNGAMLYDRHLMQPLFTLSIGNPGSSFAVEIARKIGLPEEVIAHASEKVGGDYINMDKYLQDISRDKRYWSRKRDEIRRESKRLGEVTTDYESNLEDINRQKKEILSKAKEEAKQLLAESNALIENTIREIRESQADKERTMQARKSLSDFKTKVEQKEEIAPKPKKKRIKQVRKAIPEQNKLQAGDFVRLEGQTSAGKVIEVHDKKATVAFGMLKSTIDLEKLERVSKNQIKKDDTNRHSYNQSSSDIIYNKKLDFKQEIDVRGMRVDEALQAVMYFIDDAIQVGVGRVRILHGTGTGALRQVIREYLSTVNGVKNYRDEHVQFGGSGITVIEMD